MDRCTAEEEESTGAAANAASTSGCAPGVGSARRLLAHLLGSGAVRVGLFGASTDAAAMRLATGHRLRSCPAPDIRSGEPGALDKVARLAAAWFVTYRR
jgi:hypothetical protein